MPIQNLRNFEKRMQNIATYKEFTDKKNKRKRKPFRLFGKTPEWVLYLASVLIVAASWGLYLWMSRPPRVVVNLPPDAVQVRDLAETRTDKGWVVDGVITNATASSVGKADYIISYTDDSGNQVTQVMLEGKALQPRENRRFRLLVPEYAPGLKRTVVPVGYSPN